MGEPSSSAVPRSSNKRSPAPPKKKKKVNDLSSPRNKKKIEEISDILNHVTRLLRSAPKNKDIFNTWQSAIDSPWSSKIYSLKDDKFELMPPQYSQRKGKHNCWAVSHFRQWYVMNGLRGANGPALTLDILQQGISFRYQSECGGLKKIEALGDFMMRGRYVKDIKFHYKPQGVDSEEKNEEFERFLISLLRRDRVVAVLFRVYPSYRQNQTRIWTPTELERIGEDYERKGIMHNALLTGHGFCVSTGKAFWEIYESYGRGYGVNGFTRLAMHEGLILRATEMEL